ncbi:MAG: ABC transporter ATP-binding protein [Alphaproteobacteria bacterium]|nr:ABC transporter ATP-binding protein [Alphaproteobacteria bacterium]
MALLEVQGLKLALRGHSSGLRFGRARRIEILKGIDFTLDAGESLGIVGESGSGKTSLGRTIIRLHEPSAGSVRFADREITHLNASALRGLRKDMQMIFQDPMSSLNPRRRIGPILAQPLHAFDRRTKAETVQRVAQLLDLVALPRSFAARYPHELSGGQRQRVGIARALALEPKLVIADEIVSGLDVSTQAQILALLRSLKERLGLALIFISHDLSVVRVLCDRVLVLLAGEVVEQGPCEEVFRKPRHPYTRELLEAIPLPDVDPDWLDAVAVDP